MSTENGYIILKLIIVIIEHDKNLAIVIHTRADYFFHLIYQIFSIESKGEILIETLSKVIEVDKIETNSKKEIIAICPKCGKNVYQGKTKIDKLNYSCEGYKNGCKFTLWEEAKHYKNPIKITKAKLLLKKME
ncbi:hypothetical protein NRK67_00710 [Fusobacteria bacterium ZRK30]|nr:hypothetical protein NRK67_00710 [Fusobacteria bacterium ZRK30]